MFAIWILDFLLHFVYLFIYLLAPAPVLLQPMLQPIRGRGLGVARRALTEDMTYVSVTGEDVWMMGG